MAAPPAGCEAAMDRKLEEVMGIFIRRYLI
jgi:hypothetical protein